MSSKQFTAKTFAWLRQINHGRYLAIDLKVAFALTSYFTESDHGGRAYPSYKTLGDAIGVSEQTVIRAIDRMRRGGDLYVIPGKPGRGHPNQYWMLLKPPPVDVSDAGKPPRRPARKTSIRDEKTSIAVEENPYKNPKADRECYTLSIRGERDALTRDKKSPSGGSPPLDAGPPPPRCRHHILFLFFLSARTVELRAARWCRSTSIARGANCWPCGANC